MRDASTVVLLREAHAPAAGDGAFEVLLVERHHASAFMGGAHVFPGGKLDAADSAAAILDRAGEAVAARCFALLEATPGRSLEPSAAAGLFVAAIRETFEEAGVLLARPRAGGSFVPRQEQHRALADARRALHAGERDLASILDEHELHLDVEALSYFDHWVTPSFEERRFDARFFLARLPQGQVAQHDRAELTDQAWKTPAAALLAYADGAIYLPPPTVIVLDELLACASIEAALQLAQERTVAAILPKVIAYGEALAILMPWDAEYAEADGEALPGLSGTGHPRAGDIERITLTAGRWFSQRRDGR